MKVLISIIILCLLVAAGCKYGGVSDNVNTCKEIAKLDYNMEYPNCVIMSYKGNRCSCTDYKKVHFANSFQLVEKEDQKLLGTIFYITVEE